MSQITTPQLTKPSSEWSWSETFTHYTGYSHAGLVQEAWGRIQHNVRLTEEIMGRQPPTTVRGLCTTILEVEKLRDACAVAADSVKDSRDILIQHRNTAGWIIELICSVAEYIFNVFMGTAKPEQEIAASRGYFEREYVSGFPIAGRLVELRRGQFTSQPTQHLGVRVGETEIPYDGQNQRVGVYALPGQGHNGAGDTIGFCLSFNGRDSIASVDITPAWKKEGDLVEKNDVSFSERCFDALSYESSLERPHLLVELGTIATQESTQMMRLLQIVVEVMARNGFTLAKLWNPEFDKDVNFGKAGFRLPPLQYAQRAYLRSDNVLAVPVDLGSGPTTWGEIIRQNRILHGEGRVLPPFWRRDLSKLAQPKAEAKSS